MISSEKAEVLCHKWAEKLEKMFMPIEGYFARSESREKAKPSKGVKRQYCGRLGKVENCQVVVLDYVSMSVQGFLDRRLYLPQAWWEDEAR